jgi:hypothetical protein
MSDDTATPGADASLADDLLRGVKEIAAFIGEPPRRTFYLLEKKLIPAGKVGANYIASKRTLRTHYERLTGAAAV